MSVLPMPKKKEFKYNWARETRFVGKGLTGKEALSLAARKRFKLRYDHRGITYDPKTGKLTYT